MHRAPIQVCLGDSVTSATGQAPSAWYYSGLIRPSQAGKRVT